VSLALDLARALDPGALAEAIGMVPDPWQEEVFNSRHPRILLNCHRQSGKSTVSSVLAVHAAVYEAGSVVLLISPSMRQSGEVFRKCMTAYDGLGKPVVAEAENALSLTLENDSRIISLPGNASTVRGYSGVRLVVTDEAAYTKDELPVALSPMLAVSGGRIIALSTPNGKRGWWWRAWAEGGKTWKRVRVPVTECKRISAEFLEEEKANLGARLFAQEYMCEFVEVTDQAFGEDAIAAAFSRDVEALSFDSVDVDGPVS
jgi:hypothetical protein